MSVFDRLRQMSGKAQRGLAVERGGIAEGTRQWDNLPTDEKVRRYTAEGQGALNTGIQSAVDSAMPQLQDTLQDAREDAIRRGVSLGDIGTRNEGTLLSAFQRNIANAAGAGAMQNYQTALERQTGYRDYRTAQDNAKAERRAGGLGAVAGIAGTVLGGPLGGAIGSRLGGMFARRRPLPALPPLPSRSSTVAGRR